MGTFIKIVIGIIVLSLFLKNIESIANVFETVMKNKGEKCKRKMTGILLTVITVICIVMFGTTFVPSGSTGIRVTFGAASDEGLDDGLKFHIPFVQKIITINNKVVRTDVDAYSASKDLQQIHSTISVNYSISPESSVRIYKTIGKDPENTIVRPAIQEASKAVTARYTAEELIVYRDKVSMEMCSEIQNKLANYGMVVEDVNIIDFDFSEEFNKAIEEKQTAQQKALQAEQDLARIKVESEQKVVTARAEAEAYELKNRTITDKVVQMEFLEKWDGKMPSVVSNGNAMFDVSNLIK